MNQIIEAFSATRKWSKIVAIVFIVAFVLQILNMVMTIANGQALIAILNLIISLFMYLMPGLALLKYAGYVRRAEDNISDPITNLEDACEQQAKFFRYVGIISVVVIVLAVIGILAAIALPAYQNYIIRAGGL